MSATIGDPVKSSGSDLNWIYGEWTSTVGGGGTAATLTVGGLVLFSIFESLDADKDDVRFVPHSVSRSTTTGISTVSLYSDRAVTNGRYIIAYR